MREKGFLRWGEAVGMLQRAVAAGLLGSADLRLYQLPDGSWQLLESVPLLNGQPRVEGGVLYPGLDDPDIDVGGSPSDADPEPGIELTDAEMTGPTTGYLRATRASESDPWGAQSFLVTVGLVEGGGALEQITPFCLVIGGRAVGITR